jgi:hypothetical protein
VADVSSDLVAGARMAFPHKMLTDNTQADRRMYTTQKDKVNADLLPAYSTVMPPTMPAQSWSAQKRSYFPGWWAIRKMSFVSPGCITISLRS